jgi:hypothetical protein
MDPGTETPEVPPRVDIAGRPSSSRTLIRVILGLSAVVIVAVVAIWFFVGTSSGACSDDDLHLALQIPPYGGAQLEYFDDPEGPGCATQLEVEASGTEVLDHYETVLEDDGWDVSVEDVPVAEGPEGLTVAELTAVRGGSEVTISLEGVDGHVSAAIRVDA